MKIVNIIFPIIVILFSLIAVIGYLVDWARWTNFVWIGLGYGVGASIVAILEERQ